MGRTVINECFEQGMADWWVEGGEQVWVQDERLHMRSDGPDPDHGSVCTAWCKVPHPANFVLEVDAHVVSSKGNFNNINLFFCYHDPSGKSLFETRHERKNGDYGLYHNLSGHIVTFLCAGSEAPLNKDGGHKARVRIRRCPGFKLLREDYTYHSRQGHTYRLKVAKNQGRIAVEVDGKLLLETEDPEPLQGGLMGLRTFKTYLWWDNIKLTELEDGDA